jgi:uncharacterized RDD family membrane protein YckC
MISNPTGFCGNSDEAKKRNSNKRSARGDIMLPLTKNGEKVHAGFWRRFGAIWIDLIVMLPFMILFMYLDSLHREVRFATVVPSTLVFWAYRIYFHARWGATIGKMVTGVKITRLDGSPIGYNEALKRFSVDAVLAIGMIVAQLVALSRMTDVDFEALAWRERTQHLAALMPTWYKPLTYLQQAWFWGEFIVLLSNKRRRALHDFIAGTVVIKKEFAEQKCGHVRK